MCILNLAFRLATFVAWVIAGLIALAIGVVAFIVIASSEG